MARFQRVSRKPAAAIIVLPRTNHIAEHIPKAGQAWFVLVALADSENWNGATSQNDRRTASKTTENVSEINAQYWRLALRKGIEPLF